MLAPATPRIKPDACTIVIFGASGDLTRRKLLPALFNLQQDGLLPDNYAIVGVARRDISATFAEEMRAAVIAAGGVAADDTALADFTRRIHYIAADFGTPEHFAHLKTRLAELEESLGLPGNRLFYLSVAPEYFSGVVTQLGQHGMAQPARTGNWVRVIVEKPFGTDLESARALNADISRVFGEDQLFRIDHYLGKEAVQNILAFRFANRLFEPLWNAEHIERVEVSAAESIGIEGRGSFYEQTGAVRDVLQNHLMEVLALVAMEAPSSFSASTIRAEKTALWHAIKPIDAATAVRGQYGPGTVGGKTVPGYLEEPDVSPRSHTETFAAVELHIDTVRWAGVPFHVRGGKRLSERLTEVKVVFKPSAATPFGSAASGNVLTLRIQPDAAITCTMAVKHPGPLPRASEVNLGFNFAQAFGESTANGYEHLLRDGMLGDATWFTHRDGIEATWALFTPLLQHWAACAHAPVVYPAGSPGPDRV